VRIVTRAAFEFGVSHIFIRRQSESEEYTKYVTKSKTVKNM